MFLLLYFLDFKGKSIWHVLACSSPLSLCAGLMCLCLHFKQVWKGMHDRCNPASVHFCLLSKSQKTVRLLCLRSLATTTHIFPDNLQVESNLIH